MAPTHLLHRVKAAVTRLTATSKKKTTHRSRSRGQRGEPDRCDRGCDGCPHRIRAPFTPEEQWWNELLPLLSQKGAVAYEGTLPSNIPVTAVTGAAVVLDASTDVATLVEVPTDAGPYIVTLVRGSTTERWLAERIRPAGQ